MPKTTVRRFELLQMYCQGSAIAAVGVACAVLTGWAFHIGWLKSVLPGLVSMKANTALGLAFSGISLWLLLPVESRALRGHIARFLGLMVAFIGTATLIEYVFGVDLRIDQLLFREAPGAVATYSPGRMAPLTAPAFVAMGLALMSLDWETRRGYRPAQGLILLPILIAMLAVSGYIFHAIALTRIYLYTQVALPTAIALFLLSSAIFFARPRTSIADDLTGDGSGAVMARRFLPAVLCVPIILGWIRLQGQMAGLYGTELGLTLYCTGNIIVFAVLVWSSARQMNREYEVRRKTEEVREHLAAVVESSHDAIISKTLSGIITAWNRGAKKVFGYSATEAIGQSMQMLIPPERAEEEPDILMRIERGESVEHFETVRVRKDGKRIDISATISPIRDINGAIVGASKVARDITERKRVEEALREQASILDLAQVLVRDMEGHILLWNLGSEKLYGYTKAEAVGRIAHELLQTRFPESLQQVQRNLGATGVWEGELIHRKRNGSDVVVSSVWRLHRDTGDGPARVLESNTDITERKRVEERLGERTRELTLSQQALEAQSLVLESVLHSMTEGLAAVDEKGKFIIWNKAAENIFGMGSTDLPADEWTQHYGLFMADMVTPFPSDQLPVIRAIQGDVTMTEMYVRNHKFPQGIWIEVSAAPRKDKDGAICGGVAAFRNVTKAKADEREIRKLNDDLERRVVDRTAELNIANKALANLAAVVESSDDAIVSKTLDGTITAWNYGAQNLFGYSATEAIGKPMRMLLPPGREDEEAVILTRIGQGELVDHFESVRMRKDGTCVDVSVTISPLKDNNGVIVGASNIARNITERKRVEEALKESRESQLRFKDEFLSHVSHELRSPLTAVKQFTSILLGGLGGELNKKQNEFLQIVMKNILQLQAMIDDLLEVTRLEAGKLGVEPESISIADAVIDSFGTLRLSAGAKGVTLSYDIAPGLPSVNADPTRLRQILIILLDNAVKFTAEGGSVRVKVRLLPQDSQFVLLEVSDTGCGMTPEVAERIFERLYQVLDPAQGSRKGLGLGLFICKELVTQHGGNIWAKSQPQEGSIISFTLPVFSLNNILAPLLKNDKWPAESVALVMVETHFLGTRPSKESHVGRCRQVRSLVASCLMPNLDVFLPGMSGGDEGERLFVAAFADEKGASVLADKIRYHFQRLTDAERVGLTLSVSYTMLKPVPPDVGMSKGNIVTSLAANLAELVQSQIISEAIQ